MVSAAAVVLLGLSLSCTAAESSAPRELHPIEKKLVGTWIGQGPCVGQAIYQADGTYQTFGYGPGAGFREIGSWKIDWNALPPTLVMTPMSTHGNEDGEPLRVELLVVNEKRLVYRYSNGRKADHRRGTEKDDVEIRMGILDSAVQCYLGNDRHGGGVKLPPNLQTLVETSILRPESLLDPWGKRFQYDVKGSRNQGQRPDVWTKSPQGETVGNWSLHEPQK